MLGRDLKILNYTYQEEDKKHILEYKIHEKNHTISTKNILLGGDYHKFGKEILKAEVPSLKETTITMRRMAVICKWYKKDDQEKKEPIRLEEEDKFLPMLIQIQDNFDSVGNENPISVLVTDASCGSVPSGFCAVYIDYILNKLGDKEGKKIDQELLKNEVMKRIRAKFDAYTFEETMIFSHTHTYKNPDLLELENGIKILPDDDLGLDFEMAFDFGHSFVTSGDNPKEPLFDREDYDKMRYGKPDGGEEEEDEEIDETSKKMLDELEAFDF